MQDKGKGESLGKEKEQGGKKTSDNNANCIE